MSQGVPAVVGESPLFDVIVIGGGIIGCGIARDAALRGLSVALVEKHDFGSGTTAGSTRLIHGGLRYLATGDYRLVRMDLRERETLLRIAPHLVKPLPFLLPLPKSLYGRTRLRIGMHLYDALSYDKTLPRHRILGRDELRRVEPSLDGARFHGAALFYDCQCASPERLTIENAVDAAGHGALVQNYTEVVGAIHDDGRLVGVRVKPVLDGGPERELRGRIVVNASGPWFDGVAERMDASSSTPRLRTTKGVHIACEPFVNHAIFLESAVDGRAVFAIPWMGHAWIGTTDTDFDDDPSTAAATGDDVHYLIESLAPQLPALRSARRHWTTAGVRALVRSDGSPSGVSRMHRITTETSGLVSVLGGKLTGYRAIAEEVVDGVCRELQVSARSTTATTPLPGARREGPPVDESDLETRVAVAVHREWCRRLEDFLRRRSDLGFRPDQGREAVDSVSRLLQREAGWDDARRLAEVADYLAHVRSATPGQGQS
jgi:glycerol-3-phosphate dehydrogenase